MENCSTSNIKNTTEENLEINSKYILLNRSTIQEPPFTADLSNKLLCIEYPGIVENVDKALETLGGIRAIEMTVGNTNRRLELKYRPNDVFSKPCWGEKDYNPGILVKIKIRQPKNTSKIRETSNDSLTTYQYQVVGMTAMTIKFSRLCDFQYLPLVPVNKKKETSNSQCQYIYENIIPTKLPTWDWFISKESKLMPLFFAPPVFSRFNTSKDNKLYFERYKYYESLIPEFAEKLKKDAEKKKPSPKNIISRTRCDRKAYSVFINPLLKDTVIPSKPSEHALETLRRLALEEPFKQLKQLFDERPIWSKAALICITGFRHDRLKFLLPCVGYYFPNGPWRAMWCRYGFDPRLEPSARIYQTFDFRIRTSDGLKVKVQPKRGFNNLMHYKAGRITTEKFSLKDCLLQKSTQKVIPTEQNYILKPDVLPVARQIFYQYCDLHIPEIQDMIRKLPEAVKSNFCFKNGWFPNGFGDQCREIANRYVAAHVKTLLLEDKMRDDEDNSYKQSNEENQTNSSVTENVRLPSPIIILDDEDEDENSFTKTGILYSDGEDDNNLMDSDVDEDISMKTVDEIDRVIASTSNASPVIDDEDFSEEDLPTELQNLYRNLIISSTKKT